MTIIIWDYRAHLMTLCKTLKSLTWKVIGLMGMHRLVEVKGKKFSNQRDGLVAAQRKGTRTADGDELCECLKTWSVLLNQTTIRCVWRTQVWQTGSTDGSSTQYPWDYLWHMTGVVQGNSCIILKLSPMFIQLYVIPKFWKWSSK